MQIAGINEPRSATMVHTALACPHGSSVKSGHLVSHPWRAWLFGTFSPHLRDSNCLKISY